MFLFQIHTEVHREEKKVKVPKVELTLDQVKNAIGEYCSDEVAKMVLKSNNPQEKMVELKGAYDEIAKAAGESEGGGATYAFDALEYKKIAKLFVEYTANFVDIAKAAGGRVDVLIEAFGIEGVVILCREPNKFIEIAKVVGCTLFLPPVGKVGNQLTTLPLLKTYIAIGYGRAELPFIRKNAAKLKEEFNLDFLLRYPRAVLEDMLNCKRDFSKPLAVIAYPKADWNGAFYHNKIRELHDAGYQVVIFESGNKEEFMRMAKKVRDTWGEASLLVIAGHGEPTNIELGDVNSKENYIDIHDGDVLNSIKDILAAKAQVMLDACSTGKKDAPVTIAMMISRITGAEVFAPNSPVAINHIEFEYDKDEKPRIGSVDYFGSIMDMFRDAEVRYEKGKLKK